MEEKVYSVSEVTFYIEQLLNADPYLTNIAIAGEVLDSKSRNGHIFFYLRDESAAIGCVIFGGENRGIRLTDGQMIQAWGSVKLYAPRGIYRFICRKVKSLSQRGVMFLKLRQTYEALLKEGLFSRPKRPLPKFPSKIGVVASRTSAAFQDIIKTLQDRYPIAEVQLYHTGVQGESAKRALIKALKDVNDTEDLDVVILSRGGGSTDDLWIFNDEDVVRALFNVRHPVVTGIGHQIDTVLADLTADYAAHTPTAAAQMVVPDIKEIMSDFYESLEQHYFWIQDQVTSTHKQMRSHIQLVTRFSERYLREEKIRARTDFDNLIRVMKTIFERYSSKAEIFASRLLELDPKKPLKRGYALVKKNGSRITKKDQVLPGDILTLIFVDGIRKVMVLNEKEENN